MLRKIVVAAALVASLMLGPAAIRVRAQDSAPAKAAPEAEPGHAYRLDFTINEIEDGKKINSRQYQMSLNSSDQSQLKIGTRVPVEVKQSEIQYLDVGTTIWCRLRDRTSHDVPWLQNDVMLNVRSELSNFAIPDQQGQRMRPAIRQMNIESNVIATVGKPIAIGAVDDPNSKRQFQLEVMVTKLK